MKKIISILLTIILLISIVNIVNATGSILTIKNLEIDSKSENIDIGEYSYNGMNINSNIQFKAIGDTIKYKITLKNNENIDYTIKKITNDVESEKVDVQCKLWEDDMIIKANGEKILYVTFTCKELEKTNFDVTKTTFTFTLEDEAGEEKDVSIGICPKTGDNIILYVLIFISSVITLIGIQRIKIKRKIYILPILVAIISVSGVAKATKNETVEMVFQLTTYEQNSNLDDENNNEDTKKVTLKGALGNKEYSGEYFAYKDIITKVVFENQIDEKEGFIEKWDVSKEKDGSCMAYLVGTELYIQANSTIYFPENSAYLFFDFIKLEEVEGLENTDTSNVTSMMGMFLASKNKKPMQLRKICGIESWDTSNVTNMESMFSRCFYLEELDVSHFNTSNVTNMCAMFQHMYALKTLDVSNFDTSNVKDMSFMFGAGYGVKKSKLTEIKGLNNFDTSKVTNMQSMFVHQISLESLDLSSFNTENVTNMNKMFKCTNLATIYVSDKFITENVEESNEMFKKDILNFNGVSEIPTLIGGNGTVWNEEFTDKTYARIDGKDDLPGYFTRK